MTDAEKIREFAKGLGFFLDPGDSAICPGACEHLDCRLARGLLAAVNHVGRRLDLHKHIFKAMGLREEE